MPVRYQDREGRICGRKGLRGLFFTFFGVWLVLIPQVVMAGDANAEGVFQLSRLMDGVSASRYILALEDPGRTLTLEEVRNPVWAQRFAPLPSGRANLGLSSSAWWLKLEVVNDSNYPLRWLLESPHPQSHFIDFHIINEQGEGKEFQLGVMRPFSHRPVPSESFVVPVETPPFGRSHILVRQSYEKAGLMDTQLRIWSREHFTNHRDLIGLLEGALFGSLIYMFLYNLFIFFATRMEEYYWYVLYLLTSAIAGAANLGLGHRYFYTSSQILSSNLHIVMFACTLFFVIQFSRCFLKLKKHLPRFDRFFLIVNIAIVLDTILLFMGMRALSYAIFRIIVSMVLLFPFLSIWVWYQGEKQIRFYAMAWIVGAFFFSFSLGHWFGLNEFSILNTWGQRIAIWFEAIFFSLALADHINLLRQEKDIAQRREQETLMHAKEELEQRVQERTLDLEGAKLQADAANAAKGAFLATMSHEIRTPINGILGMAHLALQTLLTGQQRDYLNKIQASTRYLLDIINDILDFSKLEAGRLAVERISFSLDDVVESLSSLFTAKAQAQGLILNMAMDPGIPDRLMGDPLRLKQVLANLIGNAVKFTETGGIDVHIGLESREGERVTLSFSVRDSGIGMTEEQQTHLFQEFSQVDSSISRKYGGTGLGLSISQRLVTQMGGCIAVRSVPGEGSTFGFTLSFDLAAGEVPAPKYDYDEPAPEFAPAHLLLVEDNPINQQVARELLQTTGLTVTIANNGVEAVAAVEHNRYDLVLMDVQMPQMDGFQATTIIHNDPRFQDLPIIAMTAHILGSDLEKCRGAGMCDHVGKPIEPADLYRTLARWLPTRPRQHPLQTTLASATPEAPQAEMEPIAGIDLPQGLARVRHNHVLFRKLLREFYQDHNSTAFVLAEAIRQGRLEDAQRITHTLRGASGNLGADKLSEAAAHLETALKTNTGIDDHWKKFQWAMEELMQGLSLLREGDVAETGSGTDHATDRETLSPLLETMKQSLREANPQSMDWLVPMEQVVGRDYRDVMVRLRQEINAFQFEEALVLVEELEQRIGVSG
ncbi:MAG: response regulator [Magnetococcales bacterium]|nr:response regulator [Magnetococcales bacterium]